MTKKLTSSISVLKTIKIQRVLRLLRWICSVRMQNVLNVVRAEPDVESQLGSFLFPYIFIHSGHHHRSQSIYRELKRKNYGSSLVNTRAHEDQRKPHGWRIANNQVYYYCSFVLYKADKELFLCLYLNINNSQKYSNDLGLVWWTK